MQIIDHAKEDRQVMILACRKCKWVQNEHGIVRKSFTYFFAALAIIIAVVGIGMFVIGFLGDREGQNFDVAFTGFAIALVSIFPAFFYMLVSEEGGSYQTV